LEIVHEPPVVTQGAWRTSLTTWFRSPWRSLVSTPPLRRFRPETLNRAIALDARITRLRSSPELPCCEAQEIGEDRQGQQGWQHPEEHYQPCLGNDLNHFKTSLC